MISDFFTKPLQGKKFAYFRDLVLGKESASSIEIDDRSVLEKRTDDVQTDFTSEGKTTTCSVLAVNRP
jgi:hypothetical protein